MEKVTFTLSAVVDLRKASEILNCEPTPEAVTQALARQAVRSLYRSTKETDSGRDLLDGVRCIRAAS